MNALLRKFEICIGYINSGHLQEIQNLKKMYLAVH